VQTLACLGLGQIDDPRSTPALIAALADARREDATRAACAYAIGARRAGGAGTQALLAALTDNRGEAQRLAAWGLGQVGDPKTLGPLIRAYFARAGHASDELVWAIGRVTPDIDLTANDLTLTVTDDDAVYTVTLPAGSFVEKKPGRAYLYKDSAAAIAGVKSAVLKVSGRGTGKLKVNAKGVDLGNADASTHRIDVQVVTGAYDQRDSRYWSYDNAKAALTALQ